MMDSLSFLRQEWLWPVLVCVGLLWAVFLWKEYTQSGKRSLILKSIIALVAVGSLAAMVLQPLLAEERAKGVGVILSPNFAANQLDSLLLAHKGISEIAYDGNGFEKAQLDSISTAYVLGNGVEAYDFWQLENIATTYIGGKEIQGITRLKYEQELVLGDSLKVQGLYVRPAIGNWLILEDAGGNGLDSVSVKGAEDHHFTLQAKPKVAGDFVYKLVEKDSLQSVVSTEPLPLIVKPENKLQILIINTFPTFESKYLKNYLAENGHEVLVRSQLSKNKYKFENFNRKQGSIYGFTQSNLDDFDLIIIDQASYLGLSAASQRAMKEQMEVEGLGVFIQSDVSMVSSGQRFDFRLKRNSSTETNLANWPKVQVPVYPATLEADVLTQPILSSQNKILSAYVQKGAGRLGSSMLHDTYQLVLNGNEAVYQYIWSTTLSAVSQKSVVIVQWETENFIGDKDVPFRFKLRTSMPNPEVVDADNNQIALRQNLQLADEWEGTVYPRETGWNQLEIKGDSTITLSYYVAESTAWNSLKATDIRSENQRKYTGSVATKTVITNFEPMSRWLFFVAFVLAMGYLWVLPRIGRD